MSFLTTPRHRGSFLTPLQRALREREADRRHTALVLLEDLHRTTPWYCIRQRFFIRRAIMAHLPSMVG